MSKSQSVEDIERFLENCEYAQIVVGGGHTLVCTQNGELYAFGENAEGQLGLGHTEKISSPTLVDHFKGKPIQQIAAGENQTFVLLKNGELYAFGKNEHGLLGLGHTEKVSTPTLVEDFKDKEPIQQVVAGLWHALVLLKNGELYSFGHQTCGELGLGHTKHVSTPILVDYFKDKEPIQKVVAGCMHTVVLLKNGELYAFGNNEHGQLGLGYKCVEVSTPTLVAYFKDKEAIQQIMVGVMHTVVLLKNGELYVFGFKEFGQLGLGRVNEIVSTPTLVDYFKDKEPIQQIVAGGYHTFVLLKNGELFAFGGNPFGNLGLGHTNNVFTPTPVEFFSKLSPIHSIHTNAMHTIVILKNHQIFAFGYNLVGQLGLTCDNQQKTYSTPQEMTRFAPEQVRNQKE